MRGVVWKQTLLCLGWAVNDSDCHWFGCYLKQFNYGLGVTGLSRDVSWGLYISQFTFMVGVAASAVMVAILTISTIIKLLEES